jgi:hypothetical protein
MNWLELRCRVDKCIFDDTQEMEIKKCITQNDKEQPGKFNPCPNLSIKATDTYEKGDVWNKFGEMIDKSKSKDKRLT